MDLRRKAYDKLLEWKTKSDGSSALLVEGARRVGKSYLPVVTLVTQIVVSPFDPAFSNPTKPIGPFYTEAD